MVENERQRLSRIRHNLERRALVYHLIRDFFGRQGFLEVESPIRAPAIAPELNITPFQCEDCFLAASPELHMKRLLAAGYEKIFQFSHCFRKGERGRQHNPEFTLLEWYRTRADYRQTIKDTEDMVLDIAAGLDMDRTIEYQRQKIYLNPPWDRITVSDAFLKSAGWNPVAVHDPLRFDHDLVEKVVPAFNPHRPTVLLDYPAPMASLARLKPGEPSVAERAEVFIGGLELANAYSELNNRDEQEKRFKEEIEQIQREQGRSMPMPQSFIEAVGNMPPASGIALGVDRLVMLFCDTSVIDDVIAFPSDIA
jgi:elongation factor P--(R)-beta-lysine ligase